MRTDKHLLKLNYENYPEDFNNLLDVMFAYQKQKNHFSDCFNSYHWNNKINLLQNASYFDIRNNLMRDSNFTSIKNLPSRLWKMALKEAFDLHFRTYSAQIEKVKIKVSDYISKIEEFKKDKNFISSLYYVLNYICYNYNTFSSFEKAVFPYKFNSNQKKYLKSKKHFLLFVNYLNSLNLQNKNLNFKKAIAVLLSTENKAFLSLTKKFCNYLIKTTKKIYHQTRQIVSQINPTIILDSDCYKLSVDKKTGECFIDIISLNKGKRIKNIPLSGYKHSLPKIKNFASNICISFDLVEAQFYLHFSFKNKIKNIKPNLKLNDDLVILGGDFGETEMLTLSDEKAIGNGQGDILKAVAKQTEKALTKVQKLSLNDLFFGIERKNTGRRNKKNNAFNHNKHKKNINYKYRKSQEKINRRLKQHISECVNELKHHCEKNNVSELVVEDLSYSKLGRNKYQKQVFNLTKGFYGKIEQNLKDIVKLVYVNPAFTSQTCPHCGYIDKNNRNGDNFSCLECGYVPDVKCSKADYIAALNIKVRRLEPMLRMSPQKVREILMQKFEENKERICNQQKIKLVEVLDNSLF